MILPVLASFLIASSAVSAEPRRSATPARRATPEARRASPDALPPLTTHRASPPASKRTPLEWRWSASPSLTSIRGGTETLASRAMLKSRYDLTYGDLQLALEGFAELDLAPAARQRRSERTFALQEAYLEWKRGAFYLRLGRQPVRWSDSWALPSLDLWTARRFNRLFFDDLSEQFIHPTGALASWSTSTLSIEAFGSLQPAVSELPLPFPESESPWGREFGMRGKLRTDAGFDFGAAWFEKQEARVFGGSASYALEFVVPKVEAGVDDQMNDFYTVGADFFFGNFSILPQATTYRATLLDPNEEDDYYPTTYYVMLRWAAEPELAEVQVYYDELTGGFFGAAQVAHTFSSPRGLQVAAFMQRYTGNPGTLFGVYQTMTGGTVGGLKLSITL